MSSPKDGNYQANWDRCLSDLLAEVEHHRTMRRRILEAAAGLVSERSEFKESPTHQYILNLETDDDD